MNDTRTREECPKDSKLRKACLAVQDLLCHYRHGREGEVYTLVQEALADDPLEFIDNRTREECLQDIKDAKARLWQLVANDPWVYAIKRIWKGETRYRTRVPGMGWRQLIATDLDHSGLWLSASRQWAEETMEAMAADRLQETEYSLVRIAKEALPHLPCWESYKHLETFGGTP